MQKSRFSAAIGRQARWLVTSAMVAVGAVATFSSSGNAEEQVPHRCCSDAPDVCGGDGARYCCKYNSNWEPQGCGRTYFVVYCNA